MFIETKTTKDERIAINVDRILYVTETKKGCVVFDVEGMEYNLAEKYDTLVTRLNAIRV